MDDLFNSETTNVPGSVRKIIVYIDTIVGIETHFFRQVLVCPR